VALGEILFVCVHNAGRSQMAAAFASALGLRAGSAGTMPADEVNPDVVAVMKEKGVDLSAKKPKMLTPAMIADAKLVVTMGCSVEEACPKPMLARMQKKLVEWDIEDPKGKSLAQVRRIRDEVERQVAALKRSP
jgi:arsenate reductase (thioredoxin)